MNSRLLLIPAILATTAAFGDALPPPLDAHGAKSATSQTLGHHPAVLVAQKWSTRGIDPNTFIVAHPARLTLLAASETDKDRVARVEAQD